MALAGFATRQAVASTLESQTIMSSHANLIPELAGWNNGAGITMCSWISGVGRFDHALGYASVFWPDFTFYDGCIVRGKVDSAAFVKWLQSAGGDRTRVEAAMNHVHLIDLFPVAEFEPTSDLLLQLGRTLQEMWACKLAKEFPGRPILVDFQEQAGEPLSYVLTVFQKR